MFILVDNLRFNFIKFSSLSGNPSALSFYSNKAQIYDVKIRDFYFLDYLSWFGIDKNKKIISRAPNFSEYFTLKLFSFSIFPIKSRTLSHSSGMGDETGIFWMRFSIFHI